MSGGGRFSSLLDAFDSLTSAALPSTSVLASLPRFRVHGVAFGIGVCVAVCVVIPRTARF
jgi:hypothetical protein